MHYLDFAFYRHFYLGPSPEFPTFSKFDDRKGLNMNHFYLKFIEFFPKLFRLETFFKKTSDFFAIFDFSRFQIIYLLPATRFPVGLFENTWSK